MKDTLLISEKADTILILQKVTGHRVTNEMSAVGFDVLVVALASLLIYWFYQKWKINSRFGIFSINLSFGLFCFFQFYSLRLRS